jgi:rare lipoprotein A
MVPCKFPFAVVSLMIAISPVHAESGVASFYGGGKTASGEVSGPTGFTAAHRTLPFGTMVLVTNTRNGRTVVVRINDRGPFGRGRIIDVSRAAATKLGMIDSGTATVSLVQQLNNKPALPAATPSVISKTVFDDTAYAVMDDLLSRGR